MSAVEELLAQARAAAEPSAEARARVGWALKNALGNPPPIDPGLAPAATTPAPFWSGSLASYAVVGIVAVGVGLGVGFGAARALVPAEPPRTQTATPRHQPSETARAAAPRQSETVPAPPPNPGPAAAEPTPTPNTASHSLLSKSRSERDPKAKDSSSVNVHANDAPPKDPLLFVVASLQRAQSELKNGHPLQALLLLDELDQNYPSEVLLEERSAVRVHAQCAASRSPSSVVAARSFVRANPGSLYADRIRQACGIE